MNSNAIRERAAELRAQREAAKAGGASRPNAGALAPIIKLPTVAEPQEGTKAASTARGQLDQIAQQVQPADAAARAAQATQALAGEFDPFEDQNGRFYVMLRGGRRPEAVPLESEQVADAIRETARRNSKPMMGKDAIETVRSILRTSARALSRRTVYQRIGMDGGDYLLDLGDADGHVVRVNAAGVTVETSNTIPFRRGRGYGALPMPTIPTSAAQAWEFVAPMVENVPEADKLPVVAAAVEYLRADSPHPILEFVGPEGSGKTAVALAVKTAIDPFDGQAPSAGQDERDIVAAVQGSHVVLFDNVSRTGAGVEDLLCRVAMGGAVTQRAYYTNADSLTLQIHAAQIRTALVPSLRQSDTLDRALIVPIKKPRAYRPEAEVRAEYAAKLPEVLGGLLFFLHVAMRDRATVAAQRAWKHRMVAWNQTGEAIAQALGHPPGYFVEMMAGKRQRAAADYIEGDTFARALVKTLNTWAAEAKPAEKLPSYRQWQKVPGWCAVRMKDRVLVTATAQTICAGITRHCDDWTSRGAGSTLPSTARATTGALQRVQGVLGRAGIEAALQSISGAKNSAWVFLLPPTDGE
ncbi:ATP-binding protein [Azoarcus sp. PA01]|nr:ATP-binding protein [Azoarcus sp. PA01]